MGIFHFQNGNSRWPQRLRCCLLTVAVAISLLCAFLDDECVVKFLVVKIVQVFNFNVIYCNAVILTLRSETGVYVASLVLRA